MDNIGAYILLIICIVIIFSALLKKVNVFDEFLIGAKDGLKCAVDIIPALTALMTAVAMLRASGLIELLGQIAAPVLNILNLPAETLPLALLRPISGSGALSVVNDILENCGPDSYPGRAASVMMGSTETTFYTIAVYFGSVGIKKSGFTIPAALAADCTGFILSCVTVRIFFGI